MEKEKRVKRRERGGGAWSERKSGTGGRNGKRESREKWRERESREK